ncbi:hypothetical protein PFISCL1PPCAC_21095 [Pristionchus fissidentatus]|uniref:Kinesin motor domain-containing protein n=1 Tax=Pristionchus fissidentatus TaxID=1538716 RepID=A0AAV5WGL1_9BILA|nr:hypothetical protein PFISCL1PPCAC_21095 [Pristionchus fissidentatus]
MATQAAERIKVYARIRPSKESVGHRVLSIHDSSITAKLDREEKTFQFDGVFGEDAAQAEVFETAAARIVTGTLSGFNGTIFAYGQTGSGKTHTMIGPSGKVDSDAGIIPRGLQLLFQELERKAEANPGLFKHSITVSFVELYNEHIYDLIANTDEKLKIGQDSEGGVIVKGATENFVKDINDAMEVVMRGWNNRAVAETAMNRASSRSHALLMIKIRTEEVTGEISHARSAFLNLVDLAGSERVSQSKVEGDRLKETANINKSLLTLKLVIRGLSEKAGFIQFRNSTLTHILKDSLGGNARTAVMINVHPDKMYYSETLSTLNFSAEVRTIENKVAANEDLRGESVAAYQAEIKRLQDEVVRLTEQCSADVAAKERELQKWKEAAVSFERKLAVAKRNALNAAAVTRREGQAAATAQEEEIWERSMEAAAESARKLPTSNIRSLQLRELTEQLDLAEFEKSEVVAALETERKAKAELQERLNRYLSGMCSPRRGGGPARTESVSSQEDMQSASSSSAMNVSQMTPAQKKERRATRFTSANHRQSTFFRPVLDIGGDEEGGEGRQTGIEPVLIPDNVEEMKEMQLEMKINTQQQIIDEKVQECEGLARLLADAEKRIAEAEEQLSTAAAASEAEAVSRAHLAAKMERAEAALAEEHAQIKEMKRREEELNGQLLEANTQVDILHSDAELLRSTHADELKELEARLRGNLNDKEKKEFDLTAKVDKLAKKLQQADLDLTNRNTELTEANGVLVLLRDRMVHAQQQTKEKEEELESVAGQLAGLKSAWESKEREMAEERSKSHTEAAAQITSMRAEIEAKQREIEEMAKRAEEKERASTESARTLEQQVAALRIEKEEEVRRTAADLQTEVEHWKNVSHQFSQKIGEMKRQFEGMETRVRNSEANEKRIVETLQLTVAESNELKENLSVLGTHGNNKQKLHMFNKYVERKGAAERRVKQLEAELERNFIPVPPPETIVPASTVGGGGADVSGGGEGSVDENAGPSQQEQTTTTGSRRPTRTTSTVAAAAAAAAGSAASAANSTTSVRSGTRAAARK